MILIIITYLAGVLTILSPCILPVLPFVFARSQQSFLKSGLPILAGMSITFSFFSAIALVGGEWLAHANEWGRILAMILLGFFGVSLIFPHLSEKLLAPLTRAGSQIGKNSKSTSIGGSLVIGISTGLLWAPCAGPILGIVLTGAAAQGNLGVSLGLLFSYSLGAATSLAIALVAGNKFLGTLKKFLGTDRVVKKILGVAVLLGVVVIAFNLDRTILSQVSKFETANLENKLLGFIKPDMPEMTLPKLSEANAWLNSSPLTKDQLLGKVVLVDFWTYSCINCIRTLPYVKAWAEKYKNDGLVVIGVHTPEFGFEKNIENVKKAIKDLGVEYPVAIDNDYKIWNSFHNRYWPAHYFIDRQGRIRNHHFGEGKYDESEKIIRDLLSENGTKTLDEKTSIQAEGIQAKSSYKEVKSPETYLGYFRAKNFSSEPEAQHDQPTKYSAPKDLNLNQWALGGDWIVGKEKIQANKAHGKIYFKFHSRDLHLVLGAEKPIRFKVILDGHAPGEDHGVDIDKDGNGEAGPHKLYQLIRLKDSKPTQDHVFEIEFLEPGMEAFAFTFG